MSNPSVPYFWTLLILGVHVAVFAAPEVTRITTYEQVRKEVVEKFEKLELDLTPPRKAAVQKEDRKLQSHQQRLINLADAVRRWEARTCSPQTECQKIAKTNHVEQLRLLNAELSNIAAVRSDKIKDHFDKLDAERLKGEAAGTEIAWKPFFESLGKRLYRDFTTDMAIRSDLRAMQAACTVGYTLTSNHGVRDVQIVKSSGNTTFDTYILNLVKRLEGVVPSFPEGSTFTEVSKTSTFSWNMPGQKGLTITEPIREVR